MLKWHPLYSIGIKEIDDQHQKFILVLGQFYKAIDTGQIEANLEQIFTELTEYTKFHFATEEKYFKEFGYTKTQEHQAKHQEFKRILAGYRKQLKEDTLKPILTMVTYLENWLVEHLATADKDYVLLFKKHGLK